MKIMIALVVAAIAAGVTVGALLVTSPPADVTNGPDAAVIMGASHPAGNSCCATPEAAAKQVAGKAATDACCAVPASGEEAKTAQPIAQQPDLTDAEAQVAANLVSQATQTVTATADSDAPACEHCAAAE